MQLCTRNQMNWVELIAGEPYASQHTILCNSGKKPKIVGCKIRSMSSQFVFLLSEVFTFVWWHHVNALGRDREISSKFPESKQITNQVSVWKWLFLIPRCLYLLVKVFIKVSIHSVKVMNLEEDPEDERFFILYGFGCSICPFANKCRRCEDIDQILLHRESIWRRRKYFLCAFSRIDVPGKHSAIWN